MKFRARSVTIVLLWLGLISSRAFPAPAETAPAPNGSVAVLLVDTDRTLGQIDEKIYGQFLEHINHSVVDGLDAEQIRGRGFEGKDFETYWKPFGQRGSASLATVKFLAGEKSLRLQVSDGLAGVRQDRIYVQAGQAYNGSVWLQPESGAPRVTLRLTDTNGQSLAALPLAVTGTGWTDVPYAFTSPRTDPQAHLEIVAEGTGAVLVDYVSLMRADARAHGGLRPDLLQALQGLRPAFIRWPGGSFASSYFWEDGIGPVAARKYHPNPIWGGYSDYYSFGTDEFLELCRQLNAEPLVVLPANQTDPAHVRYAMDWVHYLNDPPTTEWGRRRAANGHPAPYDVRLFQIDNEPMNLGLNAERYAEIVNLYGRELRRIAPHARIVACGQKRSNDMEWSEKLIDLAGDNFDILGCHNYEYENDRFETGLRRIEDYLVKLRSYIHGSRHPAIQVGVLEWSLCRSYDWRAGLHAAGSLILYEKLSPTLAMACPALLMRNTTDDPEWRAWIYHDHVSWFPGAGYVVEKLFRAHYAEKYLASTTGTFRDRPDRSAFFDDIAQMKPEGWKPETVDAIATASADGKHFVIKAVNYEDQPNTLLVRLEGSAVPSRAAVHVYTIRADLTDSASLEHANRIQPVETTQPFSRDLAVALPAYSVLVVDIAAE